MTISTKFAFWESLVDVFFSNFQLQLNPSFLLQDYLLNCLNQIEAMIEENYTPSFPNESTVIENETTPRPDEFTPPPLTTEKFSGHENALTPTDVRDVHF